MMKRRSFPGCLLIIFICLLFCGQVRGQIITTILGNGTAGYGGDDGPPSGAILNTPVKVKFDHAGNMYIADHGNNVIREINNSGLIMTVAGNGARGYSGDGGLATNAKLAGPSDIAFDAAGNLYISEFGNEIIRKINMSGIISTIAGSGSTGNSGDNGPATAAQLNDPFGLVFDNAGNLYFSDNGNSRVRKINTAGIITTVAGNGTIGGFSGDGGPATNAQIFYGGYLAFGPSGDLFIADYGNYRIRKLDAAGIITTVIGNGTGSNTGDGGPATAATIAEMWSILFDPAGNMYLTGLSGNYIRKVDAAGIITTIAGTGTPGYSGDGGPATNAQMGFQVNCSAVDALGNLYIADYTNNRIRRITYDSIGLGVNEVKNVLNNVSVYPNPAHSEIMIHASEKIESVAIMNVVGEVVASPRPSPQVEREVSLNVQDLPAGIYFVKVNGVYAGRFVKE